MGDRTMYRISMYEKPLTQFSFSGMFFDGQFAQEPAVAHRKAREYAEVCGQYDYYAKEYEKGKLVRESHWAKRDGQGWVEIEAAEPTTAKP